MRRTVERSRETSSTRPTSPAPVTTGMSTPTPSLSPFPIWTVSSKLLCAPSTTGAATESASSTNGRSSSFLSSLFSSVAARARAPWPRASSSWRFRREFSSLSDAALVTPSIQSPTGENTVSTTPAIGLTTSCAPPRSAEIGPDSRTSSVMSVMAVNRISARTVRRRFPRWYTTTGSLAPSLAFRSGLQTTTRRRLGRAPAPCRSVVLRREQNSLERVELFEALPRPEHDGVQRILRPAYGQAGDEVTPADLGVQLFLERPCARELRLDVLGRPLSERERILLLAEVDERLVDLVARDAYRLTGDDAAERDDCDLGRAAADVDDHVAARLVDRQAGADGGSHGLLDDVRRLPRPRVLGRLLDGALLDAGDPGRDADHHPGLGPPTLVNPLDEVAEHLLADVEVGDHAVLQGTNRLDVGRGAPDHPLRLHAHRQRPVVLGVDRDDRRLVQHDSLAAHVDDGVRGAEVDSHVVADDGGQPRSGHLVNGSWRWEATRV